MGGQPVGSWSTAETAGDAGSTPWRYEEVGMFQGRMSRSALAATEGWSSRKLTSGENSTTPATGRCRVRTHRVHERCGQASAARVPGHHHPGRVDPAGEERLEDEHGILQAGRERELRREPQVGHEDVAPGPAGQPCGKDAVHVLRRRPIAAATMEIDARCPRSRRTSGGTRCRGSGDGTRLLGHLEGAHDRGQHHPAEVVEDHLHRAGTRRSAATAIRR